MNIQPDFEDFLKLLEDNQVDYMIVGGYAPETYLGVPYDSTAPKLTWSDVDHLRIGGAITDLTGKVLIDPAVDDLGCRVGTPSGGVRLVAESAGGHGPILSVDRDG